MISGTETIRLAGRAIVAALFVANVAGLASCEPQVAGIDAEIFDDVQVDPDAERVEVRDVGSCQGPGTLCSGNRQCCTQFCDRSSRRCR